MKRLIILLSFFGCAQLYAQELQLLPSVDPNVSSAARADTISETFGDGPEFMPTQPTWYQPTSWLGPQWEGSFELGINGSEGNAKAFSILAAGGLKRETEQSTWVIDAIYAKTEANNVLTQEYGILTSRYDWNLGDSRWFAWTGFGLEVDQFKAFDYRVRVNGGIGYHFIKNDRTTFKGRFGAGASKEFGGPDVSWTPEAVFGLDLDHKISDKQKISGTVDYYPAWDDFADYRVVTTVGWEILLDEATNLSLKVGATDRYDSTPQGLRPNDIDYYITLLWKL